MPGVVTVSPIGAAFLSKVGFEFHVPHFPSPYSGGRLTHFRRYARSAFSHKKAVASLYSFVMQAGATPALSTKCQVSMQFDAS